MAQIILNTDKTEVLATKGEKDFWKYIRQGYTKKKAYMKAYPKSNPKYASIYANKIFKKEKFKPIKENLWEQFKLDASHAYKLQKSIMNEKDTDNELKNKIADKILDRAGYSPVIKSAQLRIGVGAENPLLEKSDEELKRLMEETIAELSKIKKSLKKEDEQQYLTGSIQEAETETT